MTSTRDRILNSAVHIFSRKGYKNSTIKEIAQEAEVNCLTVFRNFDDKKTLFLEAVEQMKVSSFDPDEVNKVLTYCDIEADLLKMAKAYIAEIYTSIPLMRIYIGDGFNFDELKEEAWFIPPILSAHFLSYLEKVEHISLLARENSGLLAEMFISYLIRKLMPHDKYKSDWNLTSSFFESFLASMRPQIKCMAYMITGCPSAAAVSE